MNARLKNHIGSVLNAIIGSQFKVIKMSIYSTEEEIEEGKYRAYLQTIGGLYLSHIKIAENGTTDGIRMNENHILTLSALPEFLEMQNIYSLVKKTYICSTSDGVSLFNILAEKGKIVIYDDDNLLYFDTTTFTKLMTTVTNAINRYHSKFLHQGTPGVVK